MAAEANLSALNLTAFSTYRSFEYQTSLYDRYVSRDGKKAAIDTAHALVILNTKLDLHSTSVK